MGPAASLDPVTHKTFSGGSPSAAPVEEDLSVVEPGSTELSRWLTALSSPVRVGLLHRLGRAAFMPDLAKEFEVSRQALKKHLDDLVDVGLVTARSARRGALPATEYVANPAGLFAFKEAVQAIAVTADPSALPPASTRRSGARRDGGPGSGAGLLLVHGDTPGRWFALEPRLSWVVGRDPKADIPLAYDAFASARHAMVRRGRDGWTVTDLQSTNGTHVNFRPIPAGETVELRPGDVLTVGKSHLVLRGGM